MVLPSANIQLQLTHEDIGPFAGRSFTTSARIGSTRVDFTTNSVSFRSNCGTYTAPYTLGANFAITIQPKWTYVKGATCGLNNDAGLKTLFNQSVRYFKVFQMVGYSMQLNDANSKTVGTLKKI